MQPDIYEYNHRGLEYVNLLLTSQSLGRTPTHPLRHSIRAPPPPFQSPFITRSFVYYAGIMEKKNSFRKNGRNIRVASFDTESQKYETVKDSVRW